MYSYSIQKVVLCIPLTSRRGSLVESTDEVNCYDVITSEITQICLRYISYPILKQAILVFHFYHHLHTETGNTPFLHHHFLFHSRRSSNWSFNSPFHPIVIQSEHPLFSSSNWFVLSHSTIVYSRRRLFCSPFIVPSHHSLHVVLHSLPSNLTTLSSNREDRQLWLKNLQWSCTHQGSSQLIGMLKGSPLPILYRTIQDGWLSELRIMTITSRNLTSYSQNS